MAEEKKGLDRGILYVLIALIYVSAGIFLLNKLDWNPKMPNYSQYLVNVSGTYTDGGVLGKSYVFLVDVDDNRGMLVKTSENGEVLDAYVFEPAPASAMLLEDVIYLIFVEGNRVELVRYDGRSMSAVFAGESSWRFRPLHPARFVEGPYALAYTERSDGLRGVAWISIEKNVFDPVVKAYFCRSCEVSPMYVLRDGSVFALVSRNPVLITPSAKGVSAVEYRSTPAVVVTDVCDRQFVGLNAKGRLVFGRSGSNVLYEVNLPAASFPLCENNRMFLVSGGYLTVVSMDTNSPTVLSSASEFQPASLFEDVPYIVFAGKDSGNPEFLRTIISEFRCPDSVFPLEENVSVEKFPITIRPYGGLKWTTLVLEETNAFVTAKRVSIDEDFRCYRP
ncbi:MAG: hypothetical protein PWP76_476 [Candidatus Diapherotrites archaeon]|nr:hypothetical protein [Candidatus Diapherotrites archaeon]MDN5366631.1 hypothetical protein [Candidatus Diapherotrites archaeon]